MPRFVVMLAVSLHGETVGSTRDEFDAPTADEAERLAIDAWTTARPECTFRPLLTLAS